MRFVVTNGLPILITKEDYIINTIDNPTKESKIASRMENREGASRT